MFQPEPGATLLFPSGTAHDRRRNHLSVLMTDASGPGRQVLMVPICTLHTYSDTTCIVRADAHKFLQYDSFVAYRYSRLEFVDRLIRGIESCELIEKDRIDHTIFADIRQGFDRSKFVGRFARDFLTQYGF